MFQEKEETNFAKQYYIYVTYQESILPPIKYIACYKLFHLESAISINCFFNSLDSIKKPVLMMRNISLHIGLYFSINLLTSNILSQ